MCLEYYPECGDGGDGCCERSLEIALSYARRGARRNGSTVPRISRGGGNVGSAPLLFALSKEENNPPVLGANILSTLIQSPMT
jgi:hypothetical protein